jgi:hypothetical protein
LYALLNIIKVIRSRRVKWVGNVACMREIRNKYILVGKPEDLGIKGCIIMVLMGIG